MFPQQSTTVMKKGIVDKLSKTKTSESSTSTDKDEKVFSTIHVSKAR